MKSRLVAIGAVLGAAAILTAVGLVPGASPASAASSSYPTLAAANVRSGPSTKTTIVTVVAKNTRVNIDCYVDGEFVNGTAIWNHAPGLGWVSDSVLLTGSARPVVPNCNPPAPAPAPATHYDRQAAVAYANAHWNDAPLNYLWADCTVFASRALWAGGLPKTSAWSDRSTDSSQWTSKLFTGPTKRMTSADYFKNYLVNEAHLATITQIQGWGSSVSGAQPGDIIQYDWDADGFVDHTAIVVSTSNGRTIVAQHTTNNPGRLWSLTSGGAPITKDDPKTRSYLIHITV